MGRCNEYQPKDGDALRLGSKGGRYSSCVGHVKLCDPIVTHRPYLNALEIKGLYISRYINSSVYFTVLYFYLDYVIQGLLMSGF